jgi:hypothetical protein
MKLSGSPKMYGSFRVNVDSAAKRMMNPIMPLVVKYGWNGILSVSVSNLSGLFNPSPSLGNDHASVGPKYYSVNFMFRRVILYQ